MTELHSHCAETDLLIAKVEHSAMEQMGDISGKSLMQSHHDAVPASSQFSSSCQPAAWAERSRPGGTVGIKCPNCESPAKVRSSRVWTPLFKELRLQCTNVMCGGTYVASLTIDRAIVPSATPNPRIKLPVGQRPDKPMNDNKPEQASPPIT